MKKVTIEIEIKATVSLYIDEDANLPTIIDEIDISLNDTTGTANVMDIDVQSKEYKVTDSR